MHVLNRNIRQFTIKYIEPLANAFLIITTVLLLILNMLYQKNNTDFPISKEENIFQNKRNLQSVKIEDIINNPKLKDLIIFESQKKIILTSLIFELFTGNWTTSTQNFSIGQETKGFTRIKFKYAYKKKEEFLYFDFKCYEGKFIDHWIEVISFIDANKLILNIPIYNNMEEIFKGKKKNLSLVGDYKMSYNKGKLFDDANKFNTICNATINMTFPVRVGRLMEFENVLIAKIDNSDFIINIDSDCGLNFNLKGKNDDVFAKENKKKLTLYTNVIIIVCVINMISTSIVIYQLNKREQNISAISLITIGENLLWHSYCSASHVHFALEFANYFLYFFSLSTMHLILYFLFDLRILYFYWTILSSNEQSEILRKKKYRFYAIFYTFFFGSFFILIRIFYDKYFIYALVFSLWTPQIIFNILTDNKITLPLIYIISTSIDRIVIPFYFRGNNENFLNLKKDDYLMNFIIVYICVCIILMYVQSILGPRFICPQANRTTYDFYKTKEELLDIEKNIEQSECVICLQPLIEEETKDDIEKEQKKERQEMLIDSDAKKKENQIGIISMNTEISETSSNRERSLFVNDFQILNDSNNKNMQKGNQIKEYLIKILGSAYEIMFYFYKIKTNIKNKKYMIIQCGHIYHSDCLERWLETKKQCPNCRAEVLI